MKLIPNPTPTQKIISKYPNLNDLALEDVLDLQTIPVSSVPDNSGIFPTTGYIRLAGNDVEHLIKEIPILAFEPLFLNASGLNLYQDRYVTALQVYFACKDGEIFPLYQPICLTWGGYDGSAQTDKYFVSETGYGFIYFFNGSAFEKIENEPYNEWINAYQSAFCVKNEDGTWREVFDPSKDVSSCIFPFQTIFTLAVDNSNITKIKLLNCAKKITYDASDSIKHVIILAPSSLIFPSQSPQKVFDGPLKNRFANRSHLCPPCDGINISYDLA